MNEILLAQTAMLFIKPLLEKAGSAIGDKITDKVFWKNIKSIFIEEDLEKLEAIELKNTVSNDDLFFVEEKINAEIVRNPTFLNELKQSLNININNEREINELAQIISNLKKDVSKLLIQYSRAGLNKGEYLNKIDDQNEKILVLTSELKKKLKE